MTHWTTFAATMLQVKAELWVEEPPPIESTPSSKTDPSRIAPSGPVHGLACADAEGADKLADPVVLAHAIGDDIVRRVAVEVVRAASRERSRSPEGSIPTLIENRH